MTDKRFNTADTFWACVDRDGDCWEWRGRHDEKGYGRIGFEGRLQRADRVAWLLSFGEIPEGMCVLHRCDNPACCNPDHLFLGSQADNVADRDAKGRGARPPLQLPRFGQIAEEIRAEYARGLTTQDALAQRRRLSRRTVSDILNRKGAYARA